MSAASVRAVLLAMLAGTVLLACGVAQADGVPAEWTNLGNNNATVSCEPGALQGYEWVSSPGFIETGACPGGGSYTCGQLGSHAGNPPGYWTNGVCWQEPAEEDPPPDDTITAEDAAEASWLVVAAWACIWGIKQLARRFL